MTTSNDFIELMDKITEYCNQNINNKKQKMVSFMKTSINNFKKDDIVAEEHLLTNYKDLLNSIMEKMDSDNWTEKEKDDMYYKLYLRFPHLMKKIFQCQ
jgi:hypothetical protein